MERVPSGVSGDHGGIRLVADFVPGDHICLFYRSEDEHRGALTSFLRQGLERNERVLYICDERAPETIRGYLFGDGIDIDLYVRRGQMQFLDAGKAYAESGGFDPVAMTAWFQDQSERAQLDGYRALRATAEMTWARKPVPGADRLVEYEHCVNEIFAGRRIIGLCQYDLRQFHQVTLLEMLRSHPHLVNGTEWYRNSYFVAPGKARLDVCLDTLRRQRELEISLVRKAAEILRLEILLEGLAEAE